jgi:flagellar protein FlgJ
MLRPEFAPRAFGAGNDETGIAPSSATPGPGTFAALFGEVRAEIADFIQNGSGSVSTDGLSAEGRFYQARLQAAPSSGSSDGEAAQAFYSAVAPLARETGQRLGVSPEIIAAHAALESGWGQRPLRHANGSDTHNLFGIKADGSWSGDVAQAATTEYENGAAQQKTERFRSYPDAASAFRDFTKLLLTNPRYQGVLNTGNDVRAYAQGLARGGYATDPAYADKLVRVAARLHSGD